MDSGIQSGSINIVALKKRLVLLSGLVLLAGCDAAIKAPPTQVVYRFDDHRYLELKGYNCQGALTYVDTKRKIRSQIHDWGYRIFTKTYIHPSERYLAVMSWDSSGFSISKDYGKTWTGARYSPGGGAKPYVKDHPNREEVESFTVVNDQGFVKTVEGDLYISSKPFDDPRMMPGGTGIDYVYDGEKHHLDSRDNGTSDNSYWGKEYTSWASLQGTHPWTVFAYQANWQNIPNKVPIVKNYTGWSRMQCDPDLGLYTEKQGK